MNKPEKRLYPDCPCCKSEYCFPIAESVKKGWKEYVCADCRKVFVIKDNKIEIRGHA